MLLATSPTSFNATTYTPPLDLRPFLLALDLFGPFLTMGIVFVVHIPILELLLEYAPRSIGANVFQTNLGPGPISISVRQLFKLTRYYTLLVALASLPILSDPVVLGARDSDGNALPYTIYGPGEHVFLPAFLSPYHPVGTAYLCICSRH